MSTIALSRPRAASLRLRLNPWLLAVLALAAVLCLWNLTLDGYSNTYYAAAAKAGSVSWKAWFFGALDPGSFITVDKPPLSLWLMGLSARVFGFSSFAILLPQALCSIASVGVLYSTVKRVMGNAAGVCAGVALALTPISVAIARVNNPDALLVLLLVLSAWLLVRALETGRTKWLVWCGVTVGLAFMTKMLQGWMVLPALAITYLVAGKPGFWVRIRQLAIFGVVAVAVSAAWPVAVSLWPGSKPYIGGSTDGSIWNLILGYNGFGRITGNESGMGGGGGPTFGGAAGLWRMFNSQVGGQVAWLLPLAGISLLVGLWATWNAKRTSLKRAFFILFGLWAIVHVAVFSTQKGIFHPYYVSALAPAVAALSGAGVVLLWRLARRSWAAWGVLAASVAGTAWLAVSLLNRTADFSPWLRVAIPVAAAVAIAASLTLRFGGPRSALAVAAVAGAFALAAGPASYSVANLSRALNGNNVLAGPASAGQGGFGGGAGGPGGGGGFRGGNGGPPSGRGFPGGGTPPSGAPTQARGGGFGGGDSVSSSLISYLEAHQGSAKYLVAATGSQTTAPIIISSGKAVVTIGGFSGSDNAPTLAQFEQLVAKGEVKYVLTGGGGGGFGGGLDISSWVQSHGKAVSGYSGLYEVSATNS